MKKINILAIDPAEKTGWAINNQIYGVWDLKLKRDESFGSKLLRFKSHLSESVEKGKIGLIVFERPSGRMPAAIMSHAKLVAMIETFGVENDIPTRGYSATEIKKFATGKGNSNKKVMLQYAVRKLKYVGNDDNEVDALFLLLLAKQDLNIK